MPLKKIDATVSGYVQGVGFRYYAVRMANLLGITGWVMNLPNGKVRIVGVGEDEKIINFLKAIERGPTSAEIENVDYNITNVEKNEYSNFDIED